MKSQPKSFERVGDADSKSLPLIREIVENYLPHRPSREVLDSYRGEGSWPTQRKGRRELEEKKVQVLVTAGLWMADREIVWKRRCCGI